MKPDRLKERLDAGEVPVGHMLMEFKTPGIAKMLERADLDFVLLDMEHSAHTTADIANLIAWLKATDIAPIVRVPQPQYHFIARSLDLGALGIMVPNVKNGKQAREIVSAAKYAPDGDRGVALGNTQSDFQQPDFAEFMAYANSNTTVIIQIESVEGIENLEDIAATPGVDILWVGHSDLSQSLGIPGQFDHPDFQAAIQQVVQSTRKHNLGTGIQPGTPEQARAYLDIGFNVISYASDYVVYTRALTAGIAGIRAMTQTS